MQCGHCCAAFGRAEFFMTGTYCIADRNIQIISLYPDVLDLCRGYRTDREADYTVETAPADIEFERKQAETVPDRGYSLAEGILEELAVYRKIAERMPEDNAFLFHGSAVAVDGQAYIFAAVSGTGKSTHARLWRELLGERAVMINDDKPLIRVEESGTVVYGTPWSGKHSLSTNIRVPLKAVCILERDRNNRICRISKREALPALMQQIYRPYRTDVLAKTMLLLDRLDAAFYRLGCNMDISAAELSYNTMKG